MLLGLAGSLHCAGMCSPLMLAVTARQPWASARLLYNIGRVATYGLLGMLGAALGTLLPVQQYQSGLSFALGALLVVAGFAGVTGLPIPLLTSLLMRATAWLKRRFGKLLTQSGWHARLLLGMLNGLLPCGLTYLALAGTFILPTVADGFWYMVAFGLGTWPMMMGIAWLAQAGRWRKWLQHPRAVQVALVLAGALLMARVWWTHDLHAPTLHSSVEQKEVVCP
jgi:hypothetical protein